MLNRYKASHNKIYNYREMSLLLVLCSLFVLSPLYRNIWKRINRKNQVTGEGRERLWDTARREKVLFPCVSLPSLQSIKSVYNLSPCLWEHHSLGHKMMGWSRDSWAASTDKLPAAARMAQLPFWVLSQVVREAQQWSSLCGQGGSCDNAQEVLMCRTCLRVPGFQFDVQTNFAFWRPCRDL